MAEGQQHNRLSSPAHPLRSFFPSGSAGVPPTFASSQRGAYTCPPVVQSPSPYCPNPPNQRQYLHEPLKYNHALRSEVIIHFVPFLNFAKECMILRRFSDLKSKA